MKSALAACVIIVAAASASGTTAPAIRAGVVAHFANMTLLAIGGPILPQGTPLTLVTPDAPQKVQKARVEKVSSWEDLNARTSGPYYEIANTPGGQDLPELAIAVVGDLPATRIADAVSLRVDATLQDVRARACRSIEGLHLTLWSGAPLKAPRVWHLYYYVGYDLQPTCQPADTDGGTR